MPSGTSSASTKLVHGGLRYLEYYEFGLVREALLERETLWRIAPHIVRPMRFVLPVSRGMRPRWMLRAGLVLYDHARRQGQLAAGHALDPLRPVTARARRCRPGPRAASNIRTAGSTMPGWWC